jgi:hypothetical protein
MPVTPIGKTYKPALRVLATRHAIEAALARIQLFPGAFELCLSETETVVKVRDAEREAR